MKSVAALTLALALVTAGTAEAAITKGSFAGKLSNGKPVGLKVDRKGKVYNFFYEGVTLKCSDGDSLTTPSGKDRIITPSKVKFKVNSKRAWGIRARNNDTGFGWDADGTFNSKGTKSTGTLSVFATFNDQNQQDPNGSIRCESGALKFTVKRK
jgi:hypothetical protein